jgi:hypothetical protein
VAICHALQTAGRLTDVRAAWKVFELWPLCLYTATCVVLLSILYVRLADLRVTVWLHGWLAVAAFRAVMISHCQHIKRNPWYITCETYTAACSFLHAERCLLESMRIP